MTHVVGSSGYVCMRSRVCTREAHAAISGATSDSDAMEAYVRRVTNQEARVCACFILKRTSVFVKRRYSPSTRVPENEQRASAGLGTRIVGTLELRLP